MRQRCRFAHESSIHSRRLCTRQDVLESQVTSLRSWGALRRRTKYPTRLRPSHTRVNVPPFAMALTNVGLGQRDAVFEWLERAYEARDVVTPRGGQFDTPRERLRKEVSVMRASLGGRLSVERLRREESQHLPPPKTSRLRARGQTLCRRLPQARRSTCRGEHVPPSDRGPSARSESSDRYRSRTRHRSALLATCAWAEFSKLNVRWTIRIISATLARTAATMIKILFWLNAAATAAMLTPPTRTASPPLSQRFHRASA